MFAHSGRLQWPSVRRTSSHGSREIAPYARVIREKAGFLQHRQKSSHIIEFAHFSLCSIYSNFFEKESETLSHFKTHQTTSEQIVLVIWCSVITDTREVCEILLTLSTQHWEAGKAQERREKHCLPFCLRITSIRKMVRSFDHISARLDETGRFRGVSR